MLSDEKSQKGSEAVSDDKKIDSEVHLSTRKKVVFWGYLFSILLFSVIMTILVAIGWDPIRQFKKTDNFYYANQVTYQWKLGFITDMIITSNPQCPSGFEHAISYHWSGTNFGCYCKTAQNITFVLSGYCTPTLIQQNCRNI